MLALASKTMTQHCVSALANGTALSIRYRYVVHLGLHLNKRYSDGAHGCILASGKRKRSNKKKPQTEIFVSRSLSKRSIFSVKIVSLDRELLSFSPMAKGILKVATCRFVEGDERATQCQSNTHGLHPVSQATDTQVCCQF